MEKRIVSSPNYSSRWGTPINIIVIHTSEGSSMALEKTFSQASFHVSSHYAIGKTGLLTQFVPDSECAWHCGNKLLNLCSIGIELEGYCADPDTFTNDMMEELVRLSRDLIDIYPLIRADRRHLIGHDQVPDPNHPNAVGGVSHHHDPGPYFPWNDLMSGIVRMESNV